MPEGWLAVLEPMREGLAVASITAGCLWALIGSIGVLRFPDVYTRAHASSLSDTAGAFLVLLGAGLAIGWSLTAAKLALIFLFLLVTGPTATHAVAAAALASGVEPISGRPHHEPRQRDLRR